ncbi:GNAT family N-acetyltransferase [Cupriavidus plantarum]|uniref:RimJ/RimL family protein N-acetyltransferase n=1 Tax=Cupriavidus plantarum TaxID=942865 RepID=A0A316EQ97_9BURK|nr:GNAT family N-acetyltransferase [Cupriavidus plantarum]PWK32584.1 RimJ/RimL family protein N-acetyltransferase [Cupriavidus plantarum]
MSSDPRHDRKGSRFVLRALSLDDDIATLHRWFGLDYARYWNMQHLSLEETRQFYADMQAANHGRACLGLHDGDPAFVAEFYDPSRASVANHYTVSAGDVGMHFLVAPPTKRIPGFTRDVLRHVMAFAFETLGARRVVVEPDVRNAHVHALNRAVGFRYDRQIQLPDKTAWLAFCIRSDFERSLSGDVTDECTR